MIQYLSKKVLEVKRTETPKWGMTVDGYTLKCGGPTPWMLKLEGEGMWRRLMIWRFSNAGTLFVRINRVEYVVNEYDLPEVEE